MSAYFALFFLLQIINNLVNMLKFELKNSDNYFAMANKGV